MRKVLIGVAVLLAAAIAVPFVVPMSSYLPRLAALASAKLGQPVSIEDLKLAILPTPRAVASGLVIGRRQEIRVGEVEIVPELSSLFAERWTIKVVRASRLELKEAALPIAFGISKSDVPDPYEVRRVELREVRLQHPALSLPPVDVQADLGARYRLEHARLEIDGGVLDLALQPGENKATDIRISGTLYGGQVDLRGTLEAGRAWDAAGTLELAGVDLAPLQRIAKKPVRLSGSVDAHMTWSAEAKTADRLLDAAAIDGSFQVHDGAYHGVDLSKAAQITATRASGDATRFDEFKGVLELRGRQMRISKLCVRAPALIAGGNLQIGADQQLSGKLSVAVAKTGGFIGVPVSLSGTVAEPSVKPTTGYTIGAVVGTLILPGIGTGLGASAASAIEGSSTCE